MAEEISDFRVAVRQLLLIVALMSLGYLCIRTLRFTNDLLNLIFVCVFLVIPFLGIRPVLPLRHWTKWITIIFLFPLMAFSRVHGELRHSSSRTTS